MFMDDLGAFLNIFPWWKLVPVRTEQGLGPAGAVTGSYRVEAGTPGHDCRWFEVIYPTIYLTTRTFLIQTNQPGIFYRLNPG